MLPTRPSSATVYSDGYFLTEKRKASFPWPTQFDWIFQGGARFPLTEKREKLFDSVTLQSKELTLPSVNFPHLSADVEVMRLVSPPLLDSSNDSWASHFALTKGIARDIVAISLGIVFQGLDYSPNRRQNV
jgi:hypothetical protein